MKFLKHPFMVYFIVENIDDDIINDLFENAEQTEYNTTSTFVTRMHYFKDKAIKVSLLRRTENPSYGELKIWKIGKDGFELVEATLENLFEALNKECQKRLIYYAGLFETE